MTAAALSAGDADGKTIVPTLLPATWTTEPAAQSLTYSGAAQELVTAGEADGGTAQYKLGSDGEYSEAIPTATDAGDYTVYYKVVGDADHTDRNETSVSVTIGKRAVTLTSATDSKVYDGAALTNDTVTVSGDGFADGEGAAYDVTGTQTLPGNSANAFTYTLNEGTNADNYEITTVNGTLTVTNRTSAGDEGDTTESRKYEITLTANSGEFLYDGTEHSVSGFTEAMEYTFDGVTYTVSGVEASAKATDAGEITTTITGTPVVKDSAGNDLTAQFIVNAVDGKLTINKRSVTLTSATDSKVYDGNALTNNTVTVTGDGFIDGEGADYSVTGTQKIVGSSANDFTYTLNEGTNADNYTITKAEGTLTVTNRDAKYEISPQTNSDSVKYDGQAHTVSGFVADTFTVEGNTYTVSGLTASATGTNAGTYTVSVDGTAVVTDSDGNDVSGEFSVTPQTGTLTISKREVTLTSATAEKEYDGTALTNDGVTVSGDGFASGEGAAYSVTGTRTLVGAAENTFTYTLNGNTSADNYTITTANGNLTVTNRNPKYMVTLAANSVEYQYDGVEKTVSGWTIDGASGGAFTASNGLQYTVSGMTAEIKGTDAGTYTVNVTGTPVVKDSGGNDVTAQFAVSTESGTLKINKRSVTLTSGSLTRAYNGAALTNETVTVGGDGFADGEGAAYTVTGTQTLPGNSANAFTYTLNSGTNADNYEITTVNGTLTVTNRTSAGDEGDTTESRKYEITLTANSGEFLYDGTEHSVSGFTEAMEYTFDGVTYTVSGVEASVSGTNAGTYTAAVTGTAEVKDSAGNDLTAQFIVNTVDGKLTINKRSVTLTSATDSKVYDGNALTNNEVSVSGDGWATGEGADYSVTGTQKIVGSSANDFTYTLNEGTNADNYTITKAEGTLTVTSRDAKYEISPQTNSDSVKYDGQAQAVSGFVTDSFTVEGNAYTVSGLTASAAGTNAGTYTVSVDGTAVVTDSDGNDVSGEFSVTPQTGTLTISKRSVTLTSATDSKTYDGNAMTNNTVTVSGDGFADGEGAAYTVTGTRTLVGASENTFTYTLNDNTSADNYEISTVNGTLTVTNRTSAGDEGDTTESRKYEITLTANSGEFLYDGTEHSVSGFETLEFTFDNVAYTVSGVEASAKATDAGETDVVIIGTPVVKVKDGGETDLAAQFIVNKVDGKLTITKATPEYTVPILTATYGDTLSDVTLPSGWTWDNPAASVGDAGDSSFSVTFTPSDTGNYNIVTETVRVTVNKAAPDAGQLPSAVSGLLYDGVAHTLVTGGSSEDGVYYYRLGTGGIWSETLPSAVESGNYAVYYYLAGDKNHLDLGSRSAPMGSVSAAITSPENPVISGKVLRAEDGTEIGGASIRLMRGREETASIVTAQDGSYQLAAEPGLYNIVVEWNDGAETQTKTEMITVSGGTTKDIAVSSDSVNSVLEVMPETPGVIVGGLDAEAQSVQAENGDSVVTVRMVIERSAEDSDTSAIQSAAAGQDLDSFEIRVEKTVDSVTTPLTQTETVLELVIPFSFVGKENVRIFRVHDGDTAALTESASGEDGTFWLDKANGFIHVYANQFSTYTVAYTQCYNITGAIAYGDYTGTVTVSLVEVNSETPAASKEISLSGGMGAYSFTHIPKGTYTLTARWLDEETETVLNKEIEVR